MSKRHNPRQMSSHINNKAVVELINKLRVATPGKGSRIHRHGETDHNGQAMYNSMIGINIVNYGQNNQSVFVENNLTPAQVRELYNEAIMKRNEYSFSGNGTKIFGKADASGYSIVRTIAINRQGSYVSEGKKVVKNFPWTIAIENGKGIKGTSATGGTYCKAGTYVREKKAFINLSDGDFFALFDEAVVYLTAWENYCAHAFIKQNEEEIRKYEEEMRKQLGKEN